MNNSIFGKKMENMRKHRDEKRDKLVSEPNYYTTKRFSENLLAIKMKRKQK